MKPNYHEQFRQCSHLSSLSFFFFVSVLAFVFVVAAVVFFIASGGPFRMDLAPL